MIDFEKGFIDYLDTHPKEKKLWDKLVKKGEKDKSNQIIHLIEKTSYISISQISRNLNITYVSALKFVNELIKNGTLQDYKPNPKIRLISLTEKYKKCSKELDILREKFKDNIKLHSGKQL